MIEQMKSRHMKAGILEWIRQCLDCQPTKITNSALWKIPNLSQFKVIHIDIVGPLPSITGKHSYLPWSRNLGNLNSKGIPKWVDKSVWYPGYYYHGSGTTIYVDRLRWHMSQSRNRPPEDNHIPPTIQWKGRAIPSLNLGGISSTFTKRETGSRFFPPSWLVYGTMWTQTAEFHRHKWFMEVRWDSQEIFYQSHWKPKRATERSQTG